jgi:hypothetical protein
VEIESSIQTEGLDLLQAVDTGLEGSGGVEPVDVFGGVHLYTLEALGNASLTGKC